MRRWLLLLSTVALVASAQVFGVTAHAATSCSGVQISPGASIQAGIDSHGQGTTFCIQSGTYRLTSPLQPKTGDRFIGLNMPVLNGSKVLNSFAQAGNYWVTSGQTQQGTVSGKCEDGYQSCGRPEEVFIDGQPLMQVDQLTGLSPGSFYFDYAADKIFLAQSPVGHQVETSVALKAFSAWGQNVTVDGFKVAKFSNPSSTAAIQGGAGWLIQNNDVFDNHGVGICVTGPGQVINNHVHDNGQLGLCAQGTGPVFKGNESDHNNIDRFKYEWEAGGGKFCHVKNAVIQNNNFHDNLAIGMWVDVNSDGITIDGNRAVNNKTIGIEVEISYNATVSNNTIIGNGFGAGGGVDSTGMKLSSSPDLNVYGNTFQGNANPIMLLQQDRPMTSLSKAPHLVRNNKIHDNTIDLTQGRVGALIASGDRNLCAATSGNRFSHNTYTLSSSSTQPYVWCGPNLTKPQWQSAGNDQTGTFTTQ